MTIRDDMLARLVELAVDDADFRAKAVADLDDALAAYNIDLTAEEHDAVAQFHAQVAGRTDSEILAEIDAARTQGAA